MSPREYPLSRGSRIRLGGAVFCVLAAVGFVSPAALAYHDGPLDGYAGDPPALATCVQCHDSFPLNSGDGSLQLQGLPARYVPGVTYTLTVALADPGQSRWGFEGTVLRPSDGLQAGTLAPVDPALVQVSIRPGTLRDYIKQTALGTFAGQSGAASWQILWTAPPAGTGPAHFYLAGNAANNNGTSLGDYIYAINTQVPEIAPSGVPATTGPLALELAGYPNPIHGRGNLLLHLPAASKVSLEITDVTGHVIRTLAAGPMSGGEHAFLWDARDEAGRAVPGGMYYYILTTDYGRETRKVGVVR